MEDLSPAKEKGGDEETLTPQLMKKKGQSHHPALMNLAGSPGKELASSAIQQQRLNESKVYLKRHYLYSELGEIPVTVEQSSCLQILEDFLRNRIKTIEHVKDLKFDTCGFGGFSGSKAGGSLFGGALHGQYQSISQKIMRKNLGNQARKLLDSGNERLTKILNTGVALKIRADKKKKPKKLAEEFGMEGVEFAEKSGSNSRDESHSDYGDEQEEQEIQAEIERQKMLDQFVEEFPTEIMEASVPEDQLQQLAKILTRQHAFMVDQLKLGANERLLSGADKMELTEEHEEEMYQLELRLEDFQETMERVQSRLLDKLEEKKQRKDPPKKEEQKKGPDDQEMTDQSNDADEGKQKIESKPKFKAESSKTAAMMKPSDFSDEDVDDGRSPAEKELESQKLKLEKQLEQDFLEGEKHLEQALNREMDL